MDALLIHPPDEMEAMLGVGKEFVQKYEPLGLLYIAAVARERGYEVGIIDAHAEGIGLEPIRRRLLAERPAVVGVSVLTCSGGLAYELGLWIKRELPETLVVFGNVHASVYAEAYLANGCCDAVVHGEGEVPFVALLEARRRGGDLGRVPAISYRDESGAVRRTAPDRFLHERLSSLPFPARDLVPRELYRLDTISNQLYVGKARSCSKTMATSRGCYYKCTFCVVNQRPRFNDARRVADELEYLEREYGASYTLIIDPLCMYDRKRMFEICGEIVRRGLTIRWGCDARVSCITADLVEAMDEANCYDLSFGIETGVQRLLNRVKKGTTLAQIRKAVEIVRSRSDIKLGGLFILGLPDETEDDSLETIRFAKELPLDMAQFSLCTPYPGSALFDELRAEGAIDDGLRPGGGIDASVWKRYSAYISFTDMDPIWVTPALDPGRLRALQKRAQREFYLRPSQILRHLGRITPSNVGRVLRIARQAFV